MKYEMIKALGGVIAICVGMFLAMTTACSTATEVDQYNERTEAEYQEHMKEVEAAEEPPDVTCKRVSDRTTYFGYVVDYCEDTKRNQCWYITLYGSTGVDTEMVECK